MINISYEFTSLARLDLLEIWNYLAEEATPTLADGLLAEIEDAIPQKLAPVGGSSQPTLNPFV